MQMGEWDYWCDVGENPLGTSSVPRHGSFNSLLRGEKHTHNNSLHERPICRYTGCTRTNVQRSNPTIRNKQGSQFFNFLIN